MSIANAVLIFVLGLVLILNVVLVVRDRENAKEILILKSAQDAIQNKISFHDNLRSKRQVFQNEGAETVILRKYTNHSLVERITFLLPEAIKLMPAGFLCTCGYNSLHQNKAVNAFTQKQAKYDDSQRTKSLKGAKGERGPKGDAGLQGLKGKRGERGFSLIEPQLKFTDLNKTAGISENKTLMCKFFGSPIPFVEWTVKGNNHLVKTEVFEKLSEVESYLTISDISFKNSGNVTCRAKNILGQVEKSGFIDVQIKPAVSLSSTLFYVDLGSNSYFPKCVVVSNPAAKIVWKSVFGKLSETRSIQSGDGDFTIMEVGVEDEGYYVCTAENHLGADSRSVQLKTKPLKISYGPPSQMVVFSYPQTLSCVVFGRTEKMSGKWRSLYFGRTIDHAAIKSKNLFNITIQVKESGIYSCEFTDGVSTVERVTVIRNFTLSSNILTSIESKQQIYSWLKEKNVPTNSVGQCTNTHSNHYNINTRWWWNMIQPCYYKRNTLLVVKVSGGWVVGGFTDITWASVQNGAIKSNTTFVFTTYDDNKLKTKPLDSMQQLCFKRNDFGTTFPCFGAQQFFISFDEQKRRILTRKSSLPSIQSTLLLGSTIFASIEGIEIFYFK